MASFKAKRRQTDASMTEYEYGINACSPDVKLNELPSNVKLILRQAAGTFDDFTRAEAEQPPPSPLFHAALRMPRRGLTVLAPFLCVLFLANTLWNSSQPMGIYVSRFCGGGSFAQ